MRECNRKRISGAAVLPVVAFLLATAAGAALAQAGEIFAGLEGAWSGEGVGEVQRRLDHAAALPCELRRQRRRRPPRPVARLRQPAADVRLPHRARPDQRRDPRQLAGAHPPGPGRGLRRRRPWQVRARRARPGILGSGFRRHPRRAPVAGDHHRRRRILLGHDRPAPRPLSRRPRRGRRPRLQGRRSQTRPPPAQPVGSL